MGEAIRGKDSKLYMGTDNTTELKVADKIGYVTILGAFADERNVINVDLMLDSDDEEVLLGAKKVVTFDVTGLFRTDENAGYTTLKTNWQNGTSVKFGIVRPSGLPGVGGSCFVNKLEVSEATNEGLYKWVATLTTSGPRSVFTEPTV